MNKKAFTILEPVFAIIILGILSAVAFAVMGKEYSVIGSVRSGLNILNYNFQTRFQESNGGTFVIKKTRLSDRFEDSNITSDEANSATYTPTALNLCLKSSKYNFSLMMTKIMTYSFHLVLLTLILMKTSGKLKAHQKVNCTTIKIRPPIIPIETIAVAPMFKKPTLTVLTALTISPLTKTSATLTSGKHNRSGGTIYLVRNHN